MEFIQKSPLLYHPHPKTRSKEVLLLSLIWALFWDGGGRGGTEGGILEAQLSRLKLPSAKKNHPELPNALNSGM